MPTSPSSDRTFHIRPALDGQTLSAVMKRLLPALSWNESKKLIVNRHIHINGNLVLDETRRLKADDVIKVFAHPRAPVPTERDVIVRHLDDHLMVVEKPAGMTTLRHADERNWDKHRKQLQPTLEETLQHLLPGLWRAHRNKEKPVDGGHARRSKFHHGLRIPRVRPVHRLDRDTSGLMIFALSPQAETELVSLFKSHAIERSYLAVCHGNVQSTRIESWLVRDRGDGIRGSSPRGSNDPEAQQAITLIKPVEHLGDRYTLIECRLETGRTHQIRIHLAEADHMLCGEKIYISQKPGQSRIHDNSGAPRQALHSARLSFVHPVTEEKLHFNAPLPADLNAWLNRLRAGAIGSGSVPPKP